MKRLALFAAALTLTAVPAAAQRSADPDRQDRSQVGTRFKMEMTPMDGNEARIYLKRIGRCIARRDRDLATKVLENSDMLRIDYSALDMTLGEISDGMNLSRCIGSAMPPSARSARMSYSGSIIRGLLAEEMYLDANDDPITMPENAPVELDNRFFFGGNPGPLAGARARLADCVVYNAPELAHDFLKSNPTSGSERDAGEAIAPVFGECIGGEVELTFSLSEMRGYVADGLWSRSHYGQDSYTDAGAAE